MPRGRAPLIPQADGALPLTDAQQELWLASRLGSDASAAFNESVTIRFSGALDIDALRAALDALVARHEALRTTISADGQRQHVAAPLAVALSMADDADLAARIDAETTTPFDLERGPLLRAVLVNRRDLVLTVHHIVCDGWSFGTLVNELAALYSRTELPTAPAFRSYVEWLAAQQRTPEFALTERYWLTRFADVPPPLEMPGDRPRPVQRSFRADRRTTQIPRELFTALQRFSAGQRCTLFTTMLGAFHVLLHRLSGQDDIAVGIAAAGQAAMGSDGVVGHCLNFLPIRARLDEAQPFSGFLATLKTDVLDAFDHQQFTFGALLQRLSLPRDPSRPPLASVTFNIDRAATALKFAGVEAEFDINAKSRLGFDLSFNLIETDHGWQLYCAFSRDLFDGATIERWLGNYRTLLESIVADAAAPVGRLPLLDDAARGQLLAWGRGARNPYPHDCPIHELFAKVAASRPDAVAYEGESVVTYAELDRRANRVANHLIAKGLRAGEAVALHGERSARFLWEAIGVLRAGGAYLPLSPDEPAARLALIESKATVSLRDPNDYADASDAAVSLAVDPAGPAYLLFTSGSTGTPKGVLVPHRAIARLVCNTDYAQLGPEDVVSHQSNLSFDAATFEIWGALLNGGRLALTTTAQLLDASALATHYRKSRATAAFVTAALFNRLVREQPQIFSTFRHLLFGGERCDPVAVEIALTKGKPSHLINGYGPTETTTFAVCHHVERIENDCVPIGRPIANTDVFILDAALDLVPVGVVGELYIGGPGLAIGYDDLALTAQRFIETPLGRLYKSGDRARWLPDGTIDCLGRVDRQIKLRGFRVEPGEIEAALRAVPGVAECVVTLHEQASGDRQLVAYLTANGAEPPADSALRERLAATLPAWMLPSAFVRLARLPLTANGKLDVRALPAPDALASPDHDGKAQTTLHIELIDLWQRILGRRAIGIHDDFFHLGGHSLLAAQMLAAVEQRFGFRLPFAAMFENATISHLADLLVSERRAASEESPLVAVQAGGSETPLFFLHGDFSGGGFFCRNLARHLGETRPFFALHPHGLHGELPPATIEVMAAERLADLRRTCPHGPYLLGGFCNGAIVAYEMARQLEAEGERVEGVILIGADGSNFRYRHVESIARSMSRIFGDDEAGRAARFRAIRKVAIGADAWGRTQWMRICAATRDLGHVPRRVAELWSGRDRALERPAPLATGGGPSAVERAYISALDAYVPGPLASRVIVVWAIDDPPPGGRSPDYGWSDLSDDVRVCLVPGGHQSSIALEQNLRVVGEKIRSSLITESTC
ncbi:MAG: amino acid adenylation domain-containing protein [Chthoniobacteraceae bacterium]